MAKKKKRMGRVDPRIAEQEIGRAEGFCEVCGRPGSEIHHVSGRGVPATVWNLVFLCSDCHRGRNGVHLNPNGLGLELKLRVQDSYYDAGFSEEEVRKLMGGQIYSPSEE